MNIRKSKEYRSLTPYMATMIAEGAMEGEGASNEQIIASYQYIVDKGLDRQLQGFFGRNAQALIERGLIQARA